MDLAFLERLIDLVGRSSIGELELSRDDGWRLRLVKAGAVPAAPSKANVAVPEPPARDPVDKAATPQPARAEPPPHVVTAGIVGTFYRAAAPDKPPFVSVGDVVEDGQTIGILEAMKTFLPVESDRAGRIVAILQENGAAVATGDPLFHIVPD